MKITAIRATPVNIPLEVPFYWSVGLYPGTSKAIIEIQTDEGIIGLGEAPSWDCADVINKNLGPRLIGHDPLDIIGCEMKCVPEWVVVQNTDDASVVKAFGGIEIALWDIRGKAWNQPLYKLLGGAVRKEIPFTEYFGFRIEKNGVGGETMPEQIADYCLKMREEHGSTMFEGKLSLGDPHLEIATEWIHEPSQSLFRWQVDDVIEQGPFRQTNNVIPVPEGPGLGVTLSAKGLKRCHQRFVDNGPMDHFFNPDSPGRLCRLPRN